MELFVADRVDIKGKKAVFDAIIIPFFKNIRGPELAAPADGFIPIFEKAISLGDFAGKEGEILWLYGGTSFAKRIGLIGLGFEESISTEILRRVYAPCARACAEKKIKNLAITLPQTRNLSCEAQACGVAEGLCYGNYRFEKFRTKKEEEVKPVDKVCLIGPTPFETLAAARHAQHVMDAVYLCRDLVNGNADDVNPEYLAKVAKDISKELPKITVKAFSRAWMQKQGLDLVEAVTRSSSHDPAFIIMHYFGNPESHDHTVLVGKGVTYDTGGLYLKPTSGSMEIMKSDMAGAACVISTIKACAELQLSVNVSCVVAACENGIGPNAFKPGDVYRSYLGKTVEITNTDAEGRLTLADSIAYAVKNLSPTRVIDIATLTGAAEVALGNETIALMSNSDALAEELLQSGTRTYERLCRLPLFDEYKEGLKSDIADIKNCGPRAGGAILGAIFIKEFVQDIPWAHLDIAGTAYLREAKRYFGKYATGIGVRLLIDYLEHISSRSKPQSSSKKSRK
jgi:leucyl aminopeptidase